MANSVDPDQIAPLTWFSLHLVIVNAEDSNQKNI